MPKYLSKSLKAATKQQRNSENSGFLFCYLVVTNVTKAH